MRCSRSVAARWRAARTRRGRAPRAGAPPLLGGLVTQLLLERLDLGLRLLHPLLQGLAAPEAGRTRMGTHAHAVVGHSVHADQALRQQTRHAAGELAVQPLRVRDPKVAQRVVVDAHPAAQPAVGVIVVAQPVELTRPADTVQRRVQPQAHQNGGVDGRAPNTAFDGTDLGVQGLKIERLHEGPNGTGLVIGGQRRVQITGTQLDLVAHCALHARRALGLAPLQDSRTVRRNRQALEQGTRVPVRSRFVRDLVHAQSYAAFVPSNVHRL